MSTRFWPAIGMSTIIAAIRIRDVTSGPELQATIYKRLRERIAENHAKWPHQNEGHPEQKLALDPSAKSRKQHAVRAYDTLKVDAVLNWIDGYNSTKTAHPGVPAIFGMNFQAVSVGQKLATAGFGDDASLTGGYLDSNATPGNALTLQFQFVDTALGKFAEELISQGLDRSTLVIVSAKHGQSPIDVKDRVIQSDAPFQGTPGFGTHGFEICDNEGLIWLQPDLQRANYEAARAYLLANAGTMHIQELLDRTSLTPLFGDPFDNSRVPDFIAVTGHGVICTGGTKLAEHGGFSDDDRNVVLLLSAPKISPQIVETLTYTTQIAPTILAALGLEPKRLKGVRAEGHSGAEQVIHVRGPLVRELSTPMFFDNAWPSPICRRIVRDHPDGSSDHLSSIALIPGSTARLSG